MHVLTTVVALIGCITSFTSATALTFKLPANEKECYYAHVDKAERKLAFYFAVQSGGEFDIDYTVFGPGKAPGQDAVLFSGEKERQGDFVFTATQVGEYRFCFDNTISTFSEKLIDFEISIEHEERASLPQKGGASAEQLSSVDESIMRISGHVSVLTRQQKYFRTRENRNFSTVKSTENRIFKLSLMESGMMVAMAGLQVLVVRWFFTGGRKGYV